MKPVEGVGDKAAVFEWWRDTGTGTRVLMLYVVKEKHFFTIGWAVSMTKRSPWIKQGDRAKKLLEHIFNSEAGMARSERQMGYASQLWLPSLRGPQFSSGGNIAIKCPVPHSHEQTVGFYRDTLGLPVIGRT